MKIRMMIVAWGLAFLSGFGSSLSAELPDFYKRVDRIVWVVDDLEAVTLGWEKLSFPVILEHGEVTLQDSSFHGKRTPVSLRAATGRIGQVRIDWLEPISEGNAFSEFLEENGPGVFALVHEVPVQAILQLEITRLASLGVGVLQEGVCLEPLGWGLYSFMNTRREGKIVLGLMSGSRIQQPPAFSSQEPFHCAIAQYAFAVEDPEPVSQFWQKLGFPALTIVPVDGRERQYRGQPAEFEMNLGWQRHGEVSYEWCIPLKGPTVYQDHIEQHGEGFHHIGLSVTDLDTTIKKWQELGIPVIQSGAWGEEGKPGSGRYAYMDTYRIGGIAVELLWSFRN